MTEPARGRALPAELPLPLDPPEPSPVEGCDGCAELAAVRARSRAVGDWSTVTDCSVYMRRHPGGH